MHEILTHLFTAENMVALLTLTALEIVLGIDNIIFLSILTSKLPPELRNKGRKIGLGLAMGARIGLLLCISWVMGLTKDLFTVFGYGISGKDLILIFGGLFLVAKSTHEIHSKVEGGEEHGHGGGGATATFGSVLVQIILIDLVFSLDSVITAVGMVNSGDGGHGAAAVAVASVAAGQAKIAVMILAVMIAVGVMMVFAGTIGDFVERHPTIKILALSFLILIGVMLVAEGFDQHISKGYIYFAMAFSLVVEAINMRLRPKSIPSIGGVTGKVHPGEHIELK